MIDPSDDRANFDASVSVWSLPAEEAQAGGDWSDIVEISEDILALTVGDVSGHGHSVAETMKAVHASVMHMLPNIKDPSEALFAANAFAADRGPGVIITAIVAFLNRRLRTLTFANAGHPPPLLLSRDQHAFLEHPPADLPLGIFPNYQSANYVLALPPDALVVFYTDGVTEHARDPVRGEAELIEATRFAYDRDRDDAARAIAHEMFRQGPGFDDAAILTIRLREL